MTAPGELMVEIGVAICAASPAPRTWVLGYANDAVGYLVTDRSHDEGGYEAGRSLFVKGVEALIAGAAGRALAAVAQD